jgi:ankyrin repeat protein
MSVSVQPYLNARLTKMVHARAHINKYVHNRNMYLAQSCSVSVSALSCNVFLSRHAHAKQTKGISSSTPANSPCIPNSSSSSGVTLPGAEKNNAPKDNVNLDQIYASLTGQPRHGAPNLYGSSSGNVNQQRPSNTGSLYSSAPGRNSVTNNNTEESRSQFPSHSQLPTSQTTANNPSRSNTPLNITETPLKRDSSTANTPQRNAQRPSSQPPANNSQLYSTAAGQGWSYSPPGSNNASTITLPGRPPLTNRAPRLDTLPDGAVQAATHGDVDGLDRLIDEGKLLNVDGRDAKGDTLLCLAVKNGHFKVVRWLCDHRADVHIKGRDGMMPTQLAEGLGQRNISRFLTVWSHVASTSSLHLAALQGNAADMVRIVRNWTRELDEVETYGQHTALQLAVKQQHVECAKLLIMSRADVNKRHPLSLETPIITAVLHDNEKLVNLLVNHGADRAESYMGKPLARWAKERGSQPEIIEMLVDSGPPENTQQRGDGSEDVSPITRADMTQDLGVPGACARFLMRHFLVFFDCHCSFPRKT